MDAQTLTDNFGLAGVLAFDTNADGLVRLLITTESCSAELYLHGAHLTKWQPVGAEPVLFLSENSAFAEGKPIRGGVPIVFPWFGPRTAAAGGRTDGPPHGFARLQEWALAFAALAEDELHLTLTLGPSDESRALGYDGFRLAYQLVFGEHLAMRLIVANDGAEPMRFEEALHTYLAVGDATQVRITGLNDKEYLDKTDGMKRKVQTDPVIRFTGETDRPYFDTEGPVLLEDPVMERRIFTSKSGSRTTVVWNPWIALSEKLADLGAGAWRGMACVETANALDNAVTLAPGATHSMEARISTEPL